MSLPQLQLRCFAGYETNVYYYPTFHYCRVKCLEFLYFWLYPETERLAAAKAQASKLEPATPTTPRAERTRPRIPTSSSNAEPPRTPTDHRLRAMLESAHDAWTPTTPSKPSRTFEKTQLALSRSVAAAGMSPRKRPLHVSAGVDASENYLHDGSPRAKRSSLSQSASPASMEGVRPIRRVLPASPSARPRSILAASNARTTSTSNRTLPITPREECQSERRLSRTRLAPTAAPAAEMTEEENYFKHPPKLLWSPSKSEYPSASPNLERRRSRDSPALERQQRSRPSPALEMRDSPALGRSGSNDAKEAIRRRLSRSLHASAFEGQPYRNLTELPGNLGRTKGLFAPHAKVAIPAETEHIRSEPMKSEGNDEADESPSRGDTYERRRQILGQHLGNLDQLLHRFEVLRCR